MRQRERQKHHQARECEHGLIDCHWNSPCRTTG
jgi:hypothetical protein